MSLIRKEKVRKKRRSLRVRSKLKTGSNPYRISVFRSNKAISAQLINDTDGKTIASSSSSTLQDAKNDKTATAKLVGLDLAKKGLDQGVSSARFDRGSFLFHGRVKSLAEGLCDGGLKV